MDGKEPGHEKDKKPEADEPFVRPDSTPFTPPKESAFAPPVIGGKKRTGKALWVGLGVLVLLTVAGLLAYLWMSERDRADQLDQQVESLVEQKRGAGEGAEQTPVQAEYKAEVGKFTLTLDGKYYILVEHDGGFEGGPITQLRVVSKGDESKHTLTGPSHEAVTVSAVPIGDTNFEDRVDASLSDYPEDQRSQGSAVKVDGTEAQVWRLSGLFSDKKLFFSKNGIFYSISAGNADTDQSNSQTVLDDVVKGFKFDS